MFKFKNLFTSLVFISMLFLGCNHVSNIEAARYSEDISDWNSSALEEFGISNSYFNNYFDMTRPLVDSNMSSSEITQLEYDGLLMFAYEDIIGHSYPSNVNNGISIKFVTGTNEGYCLNNGGYGNFEIVSSGGSWAVDQLFLVYIRDLSHGLIAERYNDKGKVTQPTITVNGNNIDLYIPYVYYPANERKYYAQQLSNKLEVLTGKEFNVTLRTSNKSTVQDLDAIYGTNTLSSCKYVYGRELSSFLVSNSAVHPLDLTDHIYNISSTYSNGKYLANPNLQFVHNTTLADFLNAYANEWHNGVSPYTQRFILGNLTWNLFFSAKVERVIFSDYTVTLRGGKYLDIESSEYYIGYYFNEGVIK